MSRAAHAPPEPARPAGARSRPCASVRQTYDRTGGSPAARCRFLTGVAAAPSTCRYPPATGGRTSCPSGSPRRRRIPSAGGNRRSPTGRAIRDPAPVAGVRAFQAALTGHTHPATVCSTRVVMSQMEGTDVLYEVALTTAHSRVALVRRDSTASTAVDALAASTSLTPCSAGGRTSRDGTQGA